METFCRHRKLSASGSYVLLPSLSHDCFLTLACQAFLFMGFPRPEYRTGLPFPFPGDLPDPWIEPLSPLVGRFFTTESPGKPGYNYYYY